ncbi:MAG: TOBE domain-containing protein, partial [Pseudomonadota bacterium]
PELGDAALPERGGIAAEQQRLLRLGRGVDEDRAGGLEDLGDLGAQLLAELVVEVGERFVEASGAIFVYATTEPEEALLLGGNTATLWQGRVTQFGPTATVYRQPADATTARVFSDPPMNFLPVAKTGPRIMFGDGQTAAATGQLAGLADGRYLAGFRPNHLEIDHPAGEDEAMRFTATLSVTEITGSETFIHLDHHGERWVGLVHGVRDLALGQPIEVFLDPAHVYVFGEDGALVATAAYALAA